MEINHQCVVCHGTALPGCRNCGGTGHVRIRVASADEPVATFAVPVEIVTKRATSVAAVEAVEIAEPDQMTVGYLQDLIKAIETGQELDMMQGALRDMAMTYARIADHPDAVGEKE